MSWLGIAGAHHVAAGQQLVRRQHVVQRIARDAHEFGIAGSGADEDGIEPHLTDHLLDREQPPDQRIALESDPELPQIVDFGIDHLVGQPEIGNAVAQHSAGHMKGFEHRDLAAGLGHVGGARHPGRARTDDPDAVAVRLDVRDVGPALLNRHVADEALEPADCDRLQVFADGARAFALRFLRADTTADGSEQVGVCDDIVGAPEVLLANLADEAGDVDADRATFDAFWVRAKQAAFGFTQGIFDAEDTGYFGEIFRALSGILLARACPFLRNRPDRPFFRHPSRPPLLRVGSSSGSLLTSGREQIFPRSRIA